MKVFGGPRFRLLVGLLLVASTGAELVGEFDLLAFGFVQALLVYGVVHMMVSVAMMIEGGQEIGEAESDLEARPGPFVRLARARQVSIAVGLLLIVGSGIEILEAGFELRHLVAHGSLLGVLFLAAADVALDASHLVVGTRELLGSRASGGGPLRRAFESPVVPLVTGFVLVVACLAEIVAGEVGALRPRAVHGLLLFGVGRMLESLALASGELHRASRRRE